jgi:hypothetical protein
VPNRTVAGLPDFPMGQIAGRPLEPQPGEQFGLPNGPVQLSATPVMAGFDMAGEAAAAMATGNAGQFTQNPMEAAQLRSEAMEGQQPMASTAGAVAGDIASMGILRSPVAAARGMVQWNAAKRAEQLAEQGQKLSPFAPSIEAMLKKMGSKNESMEWLANRAGRTTEAGIEGAVLGIMNSSDPVELASYAAGTQAAGSAALGILGGLTSGGPMKAGGKMALAAASAAGLIQVFKSATPGGDDWILPTIEGGFNKVAATVGIGMLSGLVGSGRLTSPKLTASVADQITAAQRSGLYSVLSDAREDRRIETVVNRLASNPDYFGTTAQRRMERAFRNPNISITGVIDDLMESDREFRTKYMALERNQ